MTFDEQDSLIESLNAAYDKAGTITDEDIKELFAKKNAIADEDEQTSYEFDEFFAEVVSKWAQDGLTDEKAHYCSILLIALTVVWTILKTQCWKNYLWLN